MIRSDGRREKGATVEEMPLLRPGSQPSGGALHPLTGRPPRNKGRHYPADPPPVEEIIAVMRAAGTGPEALRLRALVVLLWRAGLRISEALALTETDLDPARGAVLVRCGKGGKRREVGLDNWAWEQLRPWSQLRRSLPIGAFLCVIKGPTAGGPWEATAARKQLRRLALRAGVRRRFAPHQLRHAHAVEMVHEGVPMVVIQRQLGHYAGDRVKRPGSVVGERVVRGDVVAGWVEEREGRRHLDWLVGDEERDALIGVVGEGVAVGEP
jgi:integrase